MVLAKKLRLAAAGLTDVGQRRERNQDNTTHLVPADEKVLAEKGALFVVCDGMGGHASGEVAAEIGVNTVREKYYSSTGDNIISRIAHAIKRANESIFTYSHEHPESAGMGTTCVVLVIQGGRAYFVNIGDSRAYLVRDGKMRQITQDHSWVAEQVRAGVLTEEQARTHAHRNVITRSLGTQPTVNADLFIETLRDGDRILLCSDGLHGYVEESEIEREMVEHTDPEAGVAHLIEMANANGGPDNITALVVQLLEVPATTGEIVIPSEDDEPTITQPMPAISAAALAAARSKQQSTHLTPVEKPPVWAAPKPAVRRRKGGAATAILALVAVLVLAVGGWDFGFGPLAQTRAATAQLQQDVNQAKQAAQAAPQQDPATALAALSDAQQRLFNDLNNPLLDSQSTRDAQSVLDNQLTPAVRSAVQRYNAAALIKPINVAGVHTYNISCTDTAAATSASPVALTTATAMTALTPPPGKAGSPPPASVTLYAVNSGALYQLVAPLSADGQPASGAIACDAEHLPNVSAVVTLASDGTTLYALTQQSNGAYQVLTIVPNGATAAGTPQIKVASSFSLDTRNGETPTALAAAGGAMYVAYKPGSSGTPGLWMITGKAPKFTTKAIAIPQPATAVVATNGTVYGLLGDGTLGQLDAKQTWQPLPVQLQNPLTTDDPTAYGSATPVPTVVNGSSAATTASDATFTGATLAADPALRTHIFVGDSAANRIVRFVASSSGPGLGLGAQYVYNAPLTHLAQPAYTSNGTQLAVFGWAGSVLVGFALDEPSA
ncbi:MAG: Protein serine/threonine phosphatase PrpC, regulation of stationary phase [Ktedonobacterales bacterium]|jgi:serine/threonine protein phosphatase PrpC|nr:MAG: Protein serine/threonine phosphatase PrpC, regulation of stationary phase [Ktedonobacterales bacterium]